MNPSTLFLSRVRAPHHHPLPLFMPTRLISLTRPRLLRTFHSTANAKMTSIPSPEITLSYQEFMTDPILVH